MNNKKITAFTKSFGIRKKLLLAAFLSVVLSVGITTVISSIRFSKNLMTATKERISQISLSTNSYIVEKINHQLDLLITISISETLREQLRKTNASFAQLSEDERELRINDIESIWSADDEEAVTQVNKITENNISLYLSRFKISHSEEAELFVTDKYGKVYAMSNLTSDYWQGDEEWWLESIQGNIYVNHPEYDESSQTWAIIVGVPVFENEPGSDVIGVVRGTVDISPLFESIFDPDITDYIFGSFVSTDGISYSQSDGELQVTQLSDEILPFLNNSEDNAAFTGNDIYGNSLLVSSAGLAVKDNFLGWIVIYIQKSWITRLINASIIGNVLVGLILMVLLSGASLLLSNSILNVLQNLKQETSRLAIGDYSYKFSDSLLRSTDPDVSSLVKSIEKMKDAIQTRENRIKEREKEYRQLVETMSEGLVVANPEGLITFVNPRLCQMVGFGHDEIVGSEIIHFFSDKRKENVLRLWNNPEIYKGKVYESELLTKTGKIVHVAISTEPQDDESGNHTGLLAVITDISDRKAFEMNLKRKLLEISGLREIDNAILNQANYHGVVDTVLKQLKEHLHADGAAIYVLSPKSKSIDYASAFFLEKKYEFEDLESDYDQMMQAAETKEGRQINKIHNNFLVCDHLHDKNFNVLYTMPIIINNMVHGLAEIAYLDNVELDAEWHNYFNALLTQTAVGISKIQLLEDLTESNTALKEAYDGIIKGWAKALELRDEETKGHSDRVYELSIKMALKNGFSGRKLEAFQRGALLHDIGKMGIPDNILLKPGKLSPEEWAIMKLHPELAYVLLSEIPFLKEAVEIPYYHHERWNGSGYPSGLKEKDIPLSARIFAVIDVWDALTSDRPYRKAWSIEKTKEYMINNKEILFDPELVDQFLDLLKEEGVL